MFRVEGNGKGSRKLQLFIHAWHSPAHQHLATHFTEHGGVFQLQIADAGFRQRQHRHRQHGQGFRHLIGNGQHSFACFVLQLFRADFLSIQRQMDNG